MTSKALLMLSCLQISDDGSHWRFSLGTEPRRPIMSEGGGTVQILSFDSDSSLPSLFILTFFYPASPKLQMLTERLQTSQVHQY